MKTVENASTSASPFFIPSSATTSVKGHGDAFLGFVDYARSMLSSDANENPDADISSGVHAPAPPWSWVVSRILRSCIAYSSGVTAAILLSDLFQAWNEQQRFVASKKRLERKIPFKKRHRRMRLPHTVTIDSIYEKNFLPPNSVIEAVVLDVFLLPGTNIYLISLGDVWSSCTIDLYLHRRYYDLVEFQILKKGREIILTGCCLRNSPGGAQPRLLPTEYLVVLLDEEQDEDAMLLGAQFCSDSFSLLSIEAIKKGTSYSFYARIESIDSLEAFRGVERKRIALVDGDGTKLNFVLWGEQALLANLFSLGSMLALDQPFITHVNNDTTGSQVLCLEFGSATRIYMVPCPQQDEQVLLSSTQMNIGSKMSSTLDQSQELKISQVTLPLDSQGFIDFKNYPFQLFVADLRDKMAGVSLYGVITNIEKESNTSETVFSVKLEDITGPVVIKLHFLQLWSLGKLGIGHSVFISCLTCSMTVEKKLEVSWFEKDSRNSIVNLSCLSALLNSSCLHKLSHVSDISGLMKTHVCQVYVAGIEHHDVFLVKSHVICGRPVKERSDGSFDCTFCNSDECHDGIQDSFQIRVTFADESGQMSASCAGQTATELLQITPDEYIQLPVVEQAMYICTLRSERFIVAVVNCNGRTSNSAVDLELEGDAAFEVVRAQMCE